MEKKTNKKDAFKKEYKKLGLVLIILFGILLVFTLFLSYPLMFGEIVVLKTVPVDPFDVFRGQYITLRYDISIIPTPIGAKVGNKVYVLLKQNNNIFEYNGASLTKPSNALFMKGKIDSIWNSTDVLVTYGVEQYFFEKNAEINTTDMSVEMKVASNGYARITRLIHNGKPLEIQYVTPGFTS